MTELLQLFSCLLGDNKVPQGRNFLNLWRLSQSKKRIGSPIERWENQLTNCCSFDFQAFPGNSNADSVVQHKLQSPVIARYVRLIPLEWSHNGRIGLRLETYGCPHGQFECFQSPTFRQTQTVMVREELSQFTASSGLFSVQNIQYRLTRSLGGTVWL